VIWTFDDFLDDSGKSVIEQWFIQIGVDAEAFIERRLRDIASQRRWSEKWASKYKTTELVELRISFHGIQYRPLGCYAPNFHFWLLLGAIEKGRIPRSDIETASRRRDLALRDPSRIKPHAF
jgi:hypothetical protein